MPLFLRLGPFHIGNPRWGWATDRAGRRMPAPAPDPIEPRVATSATTDHIRAYDADEDATEVWVRNANGYTLLRTLPGRAL